MEWHRDAYTISDDRSRLDLPTICKLLASTYWGSDRAPETVKRSVEYSLCFGVYKDGSMIGFARTVTDRSTVAYLCDVIIADDHRGEGLGQWLVSCVLEHPDLRDCRIDLFTRDAQEFYHRFGFGSHRFTSMVRYPPTR